jgi:SAM-dependent methyltransferase
LTWAAGQALLTIPLAARVAAVIGMDPEPDMLGAASRAATATGVTNAVWVLGRDTDLPALRVLLGDRKLAAVTIADALHWMRDQELFPALRPLLRPGGGVAVIANGAALWRQDTDWSHALRKALEQRFRTTLDTGVETERRRRYVQALAAAGFCDIQKTSVEYTEEIGIDTYALFGAIRKSRVRARFGGMTRSSAAVTISCLLTGQSPGAPMGPGIIVAL